MKRALILFLLTGCGDPEKSQTPSPTTGTGTTTATGTGTGTTTATGTGTGTTGTTPIDADGDGVPAESDCDDGDPDRYPGNPEVCDGVDNDCVGGPDDGLVFDPWHVDADGDSWGDGSTPEVLTCDGPPAGYAMAGDCDDGDATAFPNNPEICDGVDNDCAGGSDDGLIFDAWYADADGDGSGSPDGSVLTCDGPPAGWVASGDDCDDADAGRFPGNPEVCDGVDQDCDFAPDNGAPGLAWYPDADSDGFGDAAASPVISCPPVAGHVLDNSDCDDSLDPVHPGAPTDLCDGVDSDCDGHVEDLDVPGSFGTIASAVAAATNGDVLCIGPGTYNEALTFDAIDLLVIGTSGRAATAVDGTGTGQRTVAVSNGADLTVRGLTITGGEGGVLVQTGGALTLTDSAIDGNACTNCRGAGLYVYNNAGDVLLERSSVSGNTLNTDSISGYTGGGISAVAGTLTLLGSAIANNTVDCTLGGSNGRGGGINLEIDALIEDSEIVGNTIDDCTISDGAGLSSSPASTVHVTLRQTLIADNHHTAASIVNGGGIYAAYMELELENAILSGNSAMGTTRGGGGAISTYSTALTLTNVTVTGNAVGGVTATGAGLDVQNSTTALRSTTIDDNSGGSEGVRLAFGGTLTADYGNLFANGGAAVSGIADPTGSNGNISADPQYLYTGPGDSAGWSLTLLGGSALRDAGDPALLDPDGTGCDIGAYGGPGAEWREWTPTPN